MKLAVLSLAFAFSSFGLAAQSASSTGYSTYRFGAVSNGCPVSMKLQQSLSHQLQTVQDGKLIKSPATQLTLTLVPTPGFGQSRMMPLQGNKAPSATSQPAQMPAQIAFATGTVHGFGTGPQFELVAPGIAQNIRGNRSPAPKRNLKLQFNPIDGSSVADMWLPGFGAVRWLELDSITYSNGLVWKPAKGENCTVTPDPFMLVGSDSAASPASR